MTKAYTPGHLAAMRTSFDLEDDPMRKSEKGLAYADALTAVMEKGLAPAAPVPAAGPLGLPAQEQDTIAKAGGAKSFDSPEAARQWLSRRGFTTITPDLQQVMDSFQTGDELIAYGGPMTGGYAPRAGSGGSVTIGLTRNGQEVGRGQAILRSKAAGAEMHKGGGLSKRMGACQCGDKGCPVHPDQSSCGEQATQTLYRVDMEDHTGTDMCDGCAEDAYDSGLFSDGPNFYSGGEDDEFGEDELDLAARPAGVRKAGVKQIVSGSLEIVDTGSMYALYGRSPDGQDVFISGMGDGVDWLENPKYQDDETGDEPMFLSPGTPEFAQALKNWNLENDPDLPEAYGFEIVSGKSLRPRMRKAAPAQVAGSRFTSVTISHYTDDNDGEEYWTAQVNDEPVMASLTAQRGGQEKANSMARAAYGKARSPKRLTEWNGDKCEEKVIAQDGDPKITGNAGELVDNSVWGVKAAGARMRKSAAANVQELDRNGQVFLSSGQEIEEFIAGTGFRPYRPAELKRLRDIVKESNMPGATVTVGEDGYSAVISVRDGDRDGSKDSASVSGDVDSRKLNDLRGAGKAVRPAMRKGTIQSRLVPGESVNMPERDVLALLSETGSGGELPGPGEQTVIGFNRAVAAIMGYESISITRGRGKTYSVRATKPSGGAWKAGRPADLAKVAVNWMRTNRVQPYYGGDVVAVGKVQGLSMGGSEYAYDTSGGPKTALYVVEKTDSAEVGPYVVWGFYKDNPRKVFRMTTAGNQQAAQTWVENYASKMVDSLPAVGLAAPARMRKGAGTCQCGDPGCPVCQGACKNPATSTLYRVDMDDQTGTPMCKGCAADAFESGLFSDEPPGGGDEIDLAMRPRLRKSEERRPDAVDNVNFRTTRPQVLWLSWEGRNVTVNYVGKDPITGATLYEYADGSGGDPRGPLGPEHTADALDETSINGAPSGAKPIAFSWSTLNDDYNLYQRAVAYAQRQWGMTGKISPASLRKSFVARQESRMRKAGGDPTEAEAAAARLQDLRAGNTVVGIAGQVSAWLVDNRGYDVWETNEVMGRWSKNQLSPQEKKDIKDALAELRPANAADDQQIFMAAVSRMRKAGDFHEINFSPFANNVLDYVGVPGLRRADGTPVKIRRNGMRFIITIGDKDYPADSNVDASYILNSAQVGKAARSRMRKGVDPLVEQAGNMVDRSGYNSRMTANALTIMGATVEEARKALRGLAAKFKLEQAGKNVTATLAVAAAMPARFSKIRGGMPMPGDNSDFATDQATAQQAGFTFDGDEENGGTYSKEFDFGGGSYYTANIEYQPETDGGFARYVLSYEGEGNGRGGSFFSLENALAAVNKQVEADEERVAEMGGGDDEFSDDDYEAAEGATMTKAGDDEADTSTAVTFRRWPASEGGDPIAILWDMEANPGRVMMYEHVGQHGEGDPGIVNRGTKPAQLSEPDVKALYDELVGMGYKLTVVQRRPTRKAVTAPMSKGGELPSAAVRKS